MARTDIALDLPPSPQSRAARERDLAAARSRAWRARERATSAVEGALVDAFVRLQGQLGSTAQRGAPMTLADVLREGRDQLVARGVDRLQAAEAIAQRVQPGWRRLQPGTPAP